MGQGRHIGSLKAIAVVLAAAIFPGCLAQPSGPITIQPARVHLIQRAPYAVGVGLHMTAGRNLGYETGPVIDAMRSLGFTSFREGLAWRPSTPDNGQQPPPKLAAVLAAGVGRPLILIAGQLFGPGSAPLDPAARAGFAAFATGVVGATIAYAPAFEIWNEWNRTANPKAKAFSDTGAPDDPRFSGNYARLAQETTAAIKRRFPDATVVVGGDADDVNWAWLTDVVRRGGLVGADGVSVHLYNQCNRVTRGSDELLSRLRRLETMIRPIAGRVVPIYITEWGWSTGTACHVPSDFVATASSQFILGAAALPFVKGAWQYELKDEGGDPADLETSFGVLDADYRTKPSTCAVQDSAWLLRRVRAIGTMPLPGGLSAVLARMDRGNVAILWNTKGVGSVRAAGPVRAREMCGSFRAVSANQPVSVGAMPVVLATDGPLPRLTIAGG